MRRSLLITTLTALSLGAAANDGVELRTKALASAGANASVSATNYVKADTPAYGRDPVATLVHMEATPGSSGPSASCTSTTSSVCYDAAGGRIVYRGAREYMPKVDGFSADSVSIRHNAIVFKYTFQ
jgi:hypothetical protein